MKLNTPIRTRTSTLFYLAATASLLASVGEAVTRSDFKTCEQSAFACRHRAIAEPMIPPASAPKPKTNAKPKSNTKSNTKPKLDTKPKPKTTFQPKMPKTGRKPASSYKVVKGSVCLKGNTLEAVVQHEQAKVPLRLEVRFLANGAIRVHVCEVEPLVPRYNEAFKHALPDNGESLVYASPDDLVMSSTTVDGVTIHVITYDRAGKPTVAVRMSEDPWTLVCLVNDKPVMQLNTSGYFHFEHLRRRPDGLLKDVDACWEEPFEEWVDVKKRGPESVGIDINFEGFEHVYGLPEHTTPLALKDTCGNAEDAYDQPYRLFNLDVFGYEMDTPMGLYGSIPFMMAHSVETTAGVLWLNASETWVDVVTRKAKPGLGGQSSVNTHWFSESGTMDIFLFPGPSIAEMYSQYADVVGKTPLPREFALGYHQCRWNYDDQADVLYVNAKFHENNIPYDVLWLDIEYTDGKRYFTWDHKLFPDPKLIQNELAQDGHKLVTITDPHIYVDSKYSIWKEGAENGYFVKEADGSSDYTGSCWPGLSSWVDFTNPAASKWMSEQYHLDNFPESTADMFVWNDMNEPAVFEGPEHTMPRSLKHYGGWEHRDVHNLYGLLQQKSTYEGLLSRESVPKRPFVLSRSFFAGSHRYGAIWTGDNGADWEHLRMSVPMLLSCNLSGMLFCGADVGGFFGNPPPDLLTRWYQLGIWYPFFRAHAHFSSERREPWLLGEPYVSYIRNAIRERYRMLPYWYTLFREASVTALPVLRPLWMEFPSETKLFAVQDAFMVGSSIMVIPVTSHDTSVPVKVRLPGDDGQLWYDMHTHAAFKAPLEQGVVVDLANTLVFARGGAIIPMREKCRNSSAQMKLDPFTIYVYVDKNGDAVGKLYIDDGETYNYHKGGFIEREFVFTGDKLVSKPSSLSASTAESKVFGSQMSKVTVKRIVIVGLSNVATEAIVTENNSSRQMSVVKSKENNSHLSDRGCIVIDNPGVLIVNDWQIALL